MGAHTLSVSLFLFHTLTSLSVSVSLYLSVFLPPIPLSLSHTQTLLKNNDGLHRQPLEMAVSQSLQLSW